MRVNGGHAQAKACVKLFAPNSKMLEAGGRPRFLQRLSAAVATAVCLCGCKCGCGGGGASLCQGKGWVMGGQVCSRRECSCPGTFGQIASDKLIAQNTWSRCPVSG